MKCKNFLLHCLMFAFILPCAKLYTQDIRYLKDSIYIEQGIEGTPSFEPLFKMIYKDHNEDGKPADLIIYKYSAGIYEPLQRQEFNYEEGRLIVFRLSNWNEETGEWNILKEELSEYENNLLVSFTRKRGNEDVLLNERRWLYQYDDNDNDTTVILQSWNINAEAWEDTSRRVTQYSENESILSQLLQYFHDGQWENRRRRIWRYNESDFQPSVTLVQVWSGSEQAWVNDKRKTYSVNSKQVLEGTIIEQWNRTGNVWEKEIREGFTRSENTNAFIWQADLWDGEWNEYLVNEYTLEEFINSATVKEWNDSEMQYQNKLRYGMQTDGRGLIMTKIGMQSWDEEGQVWLNRAYTRKITYFWSEAETSSTIDATIENPCQISNPLSLSQPIFCDLENVSSQPIIEISTLAGQTIYRKPFLQGNSISNGNIPSGLYILRLHDNTKVFHAQKVIIIE